MNPVYFSETVCIGFVDRGNARMVTAGLKLFARIHPVETEGKLVSLTEVDLA